MISPTDDVSAAEVDGDVSFADEELSGTVVVTASVLMVEALDVVFDSDAVVVWDILGSSYSPFEFVIGLFSLSAATIFVTVFPELSVTGSPLVSVSVICVVFWTEKEVPEVAEVYASVSVFSVSICEGVGFSEHEENVSENIAAIKTETMFFFIC